MSAKGKFAVTLGLGLLLLILVVVACQPEQAEIQPMGVTNLSSLHLSDNNATATPVLMANQDGTGRIIELRDASTPVFAINDGGSMDFPGSLSSSTGAITLTDNVDITGTLDVDGAVTLNSTLDVDGNITSGTGAITVTDNVLVDGQADAVQLTIQGHTTQTSASLVVENSGGTDQFTVSDSGNVAIVGNISSGTGAVTVTDDVKITNTLDVDGAVTLNSTLDVDGNISSGTGAITITDAVYITSTVDGLADVDIGTWLNLSVQSTVDITGGSTITPTGTYQPISSTIACTTSTSTAVANGNEIGDLLILRNGNASNVIVVDGTGANVECKANVSLGAGDTLTLIWNGTDWNCVSSYDNS